MSALRPVAVLLALLAVAYAVVLLPQRDELEALRAAVEELKVTYLVKKKQVVNRDLLREQMREAERLLAALQRDLPNRIDRQFADVARAAEKRGVRIDELRPETDEQAREFHAELAALLRVSGRYHDVGAFVGDLAAAPGSLLLQELRLDPAAPGQVTLEGVLRGFRYLDDEEVAALRKRARATRKGR